MVRHSAWFVLGFVLLTTATASAEIPLKQLTTEQIRARLVEAFTGPATKEVVAKTLSIPGVAFAVSPEGIEYRYQDGKPLLLWRYRSPAPLTESQLMQVRASLQRVLIEALVQLKVNGMALVSDTDAPLLTNALGIQREVPATPPIISAIPNRTIRVDETVRISFIVEDKQIPPAELRLTARSSNPDLLPPDSFSFSGTGSTRQLTIIPASGKSGTATVTVTATDNATPPQSASSSFRLTVAPGGGPGGGSSGTTGTYLYSWGCCGPALLSVAPASAAANGTEPVVGYGPEVDPPLFNEVRRKLLLKLHAPEDAAGLYSRAAQAYRSGLHQESRDLAWAAGQLSEQDRRARVTLQMPVDARLFVDGKAFSLPAQQRTFRTPPLEPGKRHYYEFKGEVVRNGQVQTEIQKVYVKPGQHLQVDFSRLREVRTVRK